jgi:hypothetical protein
MENTPHLDETFDRDGKFTGSYKCSACKVEFRPHPTKQGAMTDEFNEHKRLVHPVKKPREDFSQAAARIVREATERK